MLSDFASGVAGVSQQLSINPVIDTLRSVRQSAGLIRANGLLQQHYAVLSRSHAAMAQENVKLRADNHNLAASCREIEAEGARRSDMVASLEANIAHLQDRLRTLKAENVRSKLMLDHERETLRRHGLPTWPFGQES